MVLLKIQGMSCERCVQHAQDALQSVTGTERAEVDLDTKAGRVWGNPNHQSLLDALDEAGYQGEITPES